MEPIKINIEVGLKESTIDALKNIFGAQIIPSSAVTENPQPEPKKAEKKAAPAPVQVEDYDDLPPADTPDPAPTPTEADARQAVKSARDRGVSAKVIKDYMQSTFGIASSVECPAERRAELIQGLAKLAA